MSDNNALIVNALVTATHADDHETAASIVVGLDRGGLITVLSTAIGMLTNEIELGCADSKLDVDEYLQAAGIVAARGKW